MKKFVLGVFTGWAIGQVCLRILAIWDDDVDKALENAWKKAFDGTLWK